MGALKGAEADTTDRILTEALARTQARIGLVPELGEIAGRLIASHQHRGAHRAGSTDPHAAIPTKSD
jgi:hypothetical protein